MSLDTLRQSSERAAGAIGRQGIAMREIERRPGKRGGRRRHSVAPEPRPSAKFHPDYTKVTRSRQFSGTKDVCFPKKKNLTAVQKMLCVTQQASLGSGSMLLCNKLSCLAAATGLSHLKS